MRKRLVRRERQFVSCLRASVVVLQTSSRDRSNPFFDFGRFIDYQNRIAKVIEDRS